MLYIVGTPIGNLKDITYRAVETLSQCDYILCEDTRTSRVLLDAYNIDRPTFAYHKFNEAESVNGIINDLKTGKSICLISDAGMPVVSDPGYRLVQSVINQGIEYTVLAGPSAFLNAFIMSGMPSPFTFVGFLPDKNSARRELLLSLKNNKTTLIFYISPHSLNQDIEDLNQVLGDKPVVYVREITKKFEQVVHSTLAQKYDGVAKGEFVVLVDNSQVQSEQIDISERLKYYMEQGFSKNDAIKLVVGDTGLKKNEIYKYAIDL